MHVFPRAARRRLVASTLAVLAIGGLMLPADASSGKKLKDQQKQAQAHVKSAQQDLDGQSKQLIAAQATLATARKELSTARSHLSAVTGQLHAAQRADTILQGQLTVAKATLGRAQSDLAAGKSDVAQQRTTAQKAILSTYLQGDPALREVQSVVDGQPLSALTSQEAYGAAVNGLQINSYQTLQSSQVILSVRTEDVATATTAVAVKEKAAAAKVAEVASLLAQAKTAADAVATKVHASKVAVHAAVVARKSDQRKLAAAQAQETKIEKKILTEQQGEGNIVVDPNAMFSPPVLNTYITSPFGWRIHPIYGYRELHNGDDLHAPCGTPERAAATGKVAAEYFNVAWGNRLFLDMGKINGHTWTAIYNHIEQYKVHTGEVVARGQVLSLAGTTGWSTACHLHFTLMRDGVAVNPTSYIHFS